MKFSVTYCYLILFITLAVLHSSAVADDFEAESTDAIEYVTVIGSKTKAFDEAGSADYISTEDLEDFIYTDVMRVLRQAPGVYVQEEEGFGLRPNIGIRGSGSDRSSRISLLEDGVLIAPAPYAAPSAYYFPSQQRMAAVEVLKGPAAIRVGSRTVGGAINFVSTPIPTERQGEITALYGSDATNQVIARYGSKVNDFAYLMEFTNYGSDGFKSIPNAKKHADDFDVQDYLLKFSYDVASVSGSNNHFGIKLSKTEQDANSSYLGLTESDFSINPFQRYAASQLDNIKTDHDQVQLNYVYTPASKFWQFGVTAYDNNFSRNWYKLQKASSENLGSILSDPVTYLTEYNWLTGALDSPDDALEVRANKRDYYGHGIQVELNSETYVGQTGVVWTLGLRYHQDQEDRFQHQDKYKIENGLMLLTSAAAPGSQTNRVSDATALSGFLDTDIGIGQWTFKPGLRYETIDLTRKDFSTSDPARSTGPTRVRNNTVNVLIPGLGVTYQLNNQWILLAGLHKGFNPPAPGSSSQEEESLNYEAGFRFDGSDTYAEVIGFYNNYNNIVGTVTASTGGNANIGDQFDGGQATVSGLEMNIGRDFIVNSDISLPINFVHTWTNKYEFDNSFNSGFEPWGNVIAGDELPYIPEHQFQASIGLQGMQWSTKLLANYTGERRSEAGQLNSSLLNSHLILDLSADYQINQYLKLFSKIENILDKEYVAAARPYGLRPGKPMAVSLGLNYQF